MVALLLLALLNELLRRLLVSGRDVLTSLQAFGNKFYNFHILQMI